MKYDFVETSEGDTCQFCIANLILYFSFAVIVQPCLYEAACIHHLSKILITFNTAVSLSRVTSIYSQISTCVFVYSSANMRRIWSSHEHWIFNNHKHTYNKVNSATGTASKMTECLSPVKLKRILWIAVLKSRTRDRRQGLGITRSREVNLKVNWCGNYLSMELARARFEFVIALSRMSCWRIWQWNLICWRSNHSVFPFTFFQYIVLALAQTKITQWKHFVWSATFWAQVGSFNFVRMDGAASFSLQCSYFSPKQNHLDVCPLFPVKCPNMCGKMEVPREKVEYKTQNWKIIMNSNGYSSMYKIS